MSGIEFFVDHLLSFECFPVLLELLSVVLVQFKLIQSLH